MWGMLAASLSVETGKCLWSMGDAHIHGNEQDHIMKVIDEGYRRVGEAPNFNFTAKHNYFSAALEGRSELVHDIYQQLQPAYDRLKGERLPPVEIIK